MDAITSIVISTLVFIILTIIIIILDIIFNFTQNDDSRITFLIIGILIISCITGFVIYDPMTKIPEKIDGKYINEVKNNDDVDIEITAKLKDGEVTRTSTYVLKGKDFTDSEIDDTNKAFTKLVRRMLDNRQKTLDSLLNVKPYDKNCKLVANNNKQYWLCEVNK